MILLARNKVGSIKNKWETMNSYCMNEISDQMVALLLSF